MCSKSSFNRLPVRHTNYDEHQLTFFWLGHYYFFSLVSIKVGSHPSYLYLFYYFSSINVNKIRYLIAKNALSLRKTTWLQMPSSSSVSRYGRDSQGFLFTNTDFRSLSSEAYERNEMAI